MGYVFADNADITSNIIQWATVQQHHSRVHGTTFYKAMRQDGKEMWDTLI